MTEVSQASEVEKSSKLSKRKANLKPGQQFWYSVFSTLPSFIFYKIVMGHSHGPIIHKDSGCWPSLIDGKEAKEPDILAATCLPDRDRTFLL